MLDDLMAAEEIRLAQFHAPMPQDGVGGRRVEVHIGQHEFKEIREALERLFLPTHLEGYGVLL